MTEEDIKSEAQAVSFIHEKGGHDNIIGILQHGWLKGLFHVYFIDMELCQFTLAEYISYFKGTKSPSMDIDFSTRSPVLVKAGCILYERIRNMWTIGKHVAEGLSFVHSSGHVHRDSQRLYWRHVYYKQLQREPVIMPFKKLFEPQKSMESTDNSLIQVETPIATWQAFEDGLQNQPGSFWLWRDHCQMLLLSNCFDGTIWLCRQAILEYPSNSAPALILIKVFEMAGDYNAAINVYMDLWNAIAQKGLSFRA